MHSWKHIIRFSLPLLILCAFIEIFAGQILLSYQELLVVFPIFLISFPVINGVGGNIGSVLGARLASGLHVGVVELKIRDARMNQNLLTALLMGVITYFILAILIYLVAILWDLQMSIGFIEFVLIFLGAGILLVGILSLASVFTAFISFKHGLDPDDMVAPVVTTLGDTFGILFLFFVIGVIGI